MFAVTLPTPQPTDDVDIYFETPADDKEHSRFQRAKEQLEIRHRSRMERVRICFVLPFRRIIALISPCALPFIFNDYETRFFFFV